MYMKKYCHNADIPSETVDSSLISVPNSVVSIRPLFSVWLPLALETAISLQKELP
jgi:hypothetical protein